MKRLTDTWRQQKHSQRNQPVKTTPRLRPHGGQSTAAGKRRLGQHVIQGVVSVPVSHQNEHQSPAAAGPPGGRRTSPRLRGAQRGGATTTGTEPTSPANSSFASDVDEELLKRVEELEANFEEEQNKLSTGNAKPLGGKSAIDSGNLQNSKLGSKFVPFKSRPNDLIKSADGTKINSGHVKSPGSHSHSSNSRIVPSVQNFKINGNGVINDNGKKNNSAIAVEKRAKGQTLVQSFVSSLSPKEAKDTTGEVLCPDSQSPDEEVIIRSKVGSASIAPAGHQAVCAEEGERETDDEMEESHSQGFDTTVLRAEDPCTPVPTPQPEVQRSPISPPPPSTQDSLRLSSWGLPEAVLNQYHMMGVEEMFSWQAQCLRTGKALQGGNLIYSAPTSAGKTLVAELLVLKKVLESKKKALIILPFVSVSREKMFYLQSLLEDTAVRVDGFMGSHSPPGGFKSVDVAVCTIEKANGLINRMLEEKSLDQLGIIVVDELHMVGDSHRGYLLELLLTKIKYVTSGDSASSPVQIVGMSATLPNLDLLARWLDADLYSTDFRPVPLTEFVKMGPALYDSAMSHAKDCNLNYDVKNDDDQVFSLCLETLASGCAVLIFCPTKNWCEKLAENMAKELCRLRGVIPIKSKVCLTENWCEKLAEEGAIAIQSEGFVKVSEFLTLNINHESLQDIIEQLKRTPAGLDGTLKRTVPCAVAYHHAGLTFDERDIIEGGFRQGHIRILIATSTLSSGVNLPARRVIIRSIMFNRSVIDPLCYRQMSGRAGRKGVDTEGESILICKPNEREKARTLISSELPPVKSCLIQREGDELSNSMKRAILEVIASGVASSPADVQRYSSSTLLAASLADEDAGGGAGTSSAIAACIDFLKEQEFIRLQKDDSGEAYLPSQLGSATLASALSPHEAQSVFTELQRARKSFVLENELHIIYQVTPIYDHIYPDWYQFLHFWEQLSTDRKRVAELVGVEERFLIRAARGNIPTHTARQAHLLAVHRRFHTALILEELVNEAPISRVAAKYGCTKGQLQSLQQSASTFAGMVTVFCSKLGWYNLELLLSQFQSRLNFGVQRELVDLVRISLLNAQRARLLYSSGYTSTTALATASPKEVETIIRTAVPFKSGRQAVDEKEFEAAERRAARCIFASGKKGLTEAEAAELIVMEAKYIVQSELGSMGIEWNPQAAKKRKVKVVDEGGVGSGDKKSDMSKGIGMSASKVDEARKVVNNRCLRSGDGSDMSKERERNTFEVVGASRADTRPSDREERKEEKNMQGKRQPSAYPQPSKGEQRNGKKILMGREQPSVVENTQAIDNTLPNDNTLNIGSKAGAKPTVDHSEKQSALDARVSGGMAQKDAIGDRPVARVTEEADQTSGEPVAHSGMKLCETKVTVAFEPMGSRPRKNNGIKRKGSAVAEKSGVSTRQSTSGQSRHSELKEGKEQRSDEDKLLTIGQGCSNGSGSLSKVKAGSEGPTHKDSDVSSGHFTRGQCHQKNFVDERTIVKKSGVLSKKCEFQKSLKIVDKLGLDSKLSAVETKSACNGFRKMTKETSGMPLVLKGESVSTNAAKPDHNEGRGGKGQFVQFQGNKEYLGSTTDEEGTSIRSHRTAVNGFKQNESTGVGETKIKKENLKKSQFVSSKKRKEQNGGSSAIVMDGTSDRDCPVETKITRAAVPVFENMCNGEVIKASTRNNFRKGDNKRTNSVNRPGSGNSNNHILANSKVQSKDPTDSVSRKGHASGIADRTGREVSHGLNAKCNLKEEMLVGSSTSDSRISKAMEKVKRSAMDGVSVDEPVGCANKTSRPKSTSVSPELFLGSQDVGEEGDSFLMDSQHQDGCDHDSQEEKRNKKDDAPSDQEEYSLLFSPVDSCLEGFLDNYDSQQEMIAVSASPELSSKMNKNGEKSNDQIQTGQNKSRTNLNNPKFDHSRNRNSHLEKRNETSNGSGAVAKHIDIGKEANVKQDERVTMNQRSKFVKHSNHAIVQPHTRGIETRSRSDGLFKKCLNQEVPENDAHTSRNCSKDKTSTGNPSSVYTRNRECSEPKDVLRLMDSDRAVGQCSPKQDDEDILEASRNCLSPGTLALLDFLADGEGVEDVTFTAIKPPEEAVSPDLFSEDPDLDLDVVTGLANGKIPSMVDGGLLDSKVDGRVNIRVERFDQGQAEGRQGRSNKETCARSFVPATTTASVVSRPSDTSGQFKHNRRKRKSDEKIPVDGGTKSKQSKPCSELLDEMTRTGHHFDLKLMASKSIPSRTPINGRTHQQMKTPVKVKTPLAFLGSGEGRTSSRGSKRSSRRKSRLSFNGSRREQLQTSFCSGTPDFDDLDTFSSDGENELDMALDSEGLGIVLDSQGMEVCLDSEGADTDLSQSSKTDRHLFDLDNLNNQIEGFESESQPESPASHSNNHHVTSVMESPTLPSTPDTFTIIDVCANVDLFETFIAEWKRKKRYAFVLGCENYELPTQGGGIGANFKRGKSKQNINADGFPIERDNLLVTGLAVSWGARDAYYISLQLNNDKADLDGTLAAPPNDDSIPISKRVEEITSVLELSLVRKKSQRSEVIKVAFDIKEQIKILAQLFGCVFPEPMEDPKVAHWLLDPSAKEKNLHGMVAQFCPGQTGVLDSIGGGIGLSSLGLSPRNPGSARVRACAESVMLLDLMDALKRELEDNQLIESFKKIEMPSIMTLAHVEMNGFGFNSDECETQKVFMQSKLTALEEQAYRLAGRTFSLTSPDDIAQVLFLELQLPPNGDTSTRVTIPPRKNFGGRGRMPKQFSTSKEALEKIKKLHPLPGLILEWRKMSMSLTKVVFPLQKEKVFIKRLGMDRILTDYQTHTATGRVATMEPNIQGIPKDFEISLPSVIGESPPQGIVALAAPPGTSSRKGGRRNPRRASVQCKMGANRGDSGQEELKTAVSLRHAFCPFPDGVLLAADYSQLELRILAHLSKDPKLIRILNNDGDVFRQIAAQWKGTQEDQISDKQRQEAKQICYGMVYGIGARALGDQLEIPEEDAACFMETFRDQYKGMKSFIKQTVEGCRELGYVQTIAGRRRYLPAINHSNTGARNHAERQAVNTTIQGSAADLVKSAMVSLQREFAARFPATRVSHTHMDKSNFGGDPRRPTRGSQVPKGSPRGAYLVLQLHDELIYEVHRSDVNAAVHLVRSTMESAMELSVRLPVKVKIGPTWGSLKEV